MYVIMCEIYKHAIKKRLVAAYPVFWMETEAEITTWMKEEPEKIIDHLKVIFPHQHWEIGDRNNREAHLWNKRHTKERIYFPKNLEKGEKL